MTEPWRPNNRPTGQRWKDCPICGLPWPEGAFTRQYGGLRCPECVEQPSHEDNVKKRQKPPTDTKPPWDPEETIT